MGRRVTGRDFLRVAERLASGAEEAEWRSAVSRGYKACFHEARDWLSAGGFSVPRGEQAHAYLWRRLSNSGNDSLRSAGSDLQSLRGTRNVADYDLTCAVSQKQALLQVGVAKTIMQRIDATTTEPLRSEVIGAIQRYERDVLKEITWKPR